MNFSAMVEYSIPCYNQSVRTVPLGGAKAAGRVALVDDDDYEFVMQHRWYVCERHFATRRSVGPYAQTNMVIDGRKTTRQMHQLLASGWSKVDHADGNGLNNQRHNLRDGSGSRNNQNQRGKLSAASGLKGVILYQKRGHRPRWVARIGFNGKKIRIGSFRSPEEAARAYDAKAVELFGEYALLNYPVEVGNG